MQLEATSIRRASTERTARAPRDGLLFPLGTWALLVVSVFVWGSLLNKTRSQGLGAPPLFGHFDFRLSVNLILAVLLAGVVVRWGGLVALKLQWRTLLAVAWLASLLWAVVLNISGGVHQLAAPLVNRFEYRGVVHLVTSPAGFLATFVRRLPTYPVHVQGHPPGMVLLLWTMKQFGLGAVGWEALLVIAAGTSSVAAALIVCRSMVGERAARRCAPFLILAPMVLWVATSADALFLGVSAWSLVLMLLSFGRRDAKEKFSALGGGLLFGAALLLSYGVLALAIVPVAVGIRERALGKLVLILAGTATVLGLFWIAGFSWVAGLQATRGLYASGIASRRAYPFFLFADLAAFAIVVGPAVAVALFRLRDRALWVLVGATLIALLLCDLSGYSKGEVERIWLPFAPWILLATADLPEAMTSSLLSLQAVVAVATLIGVRTPW